MSEKQNVLKLQKEYHELCGKLINFDNDEFSEYVKEFETIEARLREIEYELLFLGYGIDKHHVLHILRT